LTAAAAAGGFAAEVGLGQQISIDSCCCRTTCGPRKLWSPVGDALSALRQFVTAIVTLPLLFFANAVARDVFSALAEIEVRVYNARVYGRWLISKARSICKALSTLFCPFISPITYTSTLLTDYSPNETSPGTGSASGAYWTSVQQRTHLVTTIVVVCS